jgi:hypothetical protein
MIACDFGEELSKPRDHHMQCAYHTLVITQAKGTPDRTHNDFFSMSSNIYLVIL